MSDTDEQRKAQITALLEERGYAVAQGDKDRIALVDESLRAYGHEAAAPAKRASKRVVKASESR